MQQVSSLLQFYISQFSTANSIRNQNVFNNALVSSIINRNAEYTNYLSSQLGKRISEMCTVFVIDEGTLKKIESALELDFILQCYDVIQDAAELLLIGKFEGVWILFTGKSENRDDERRLPDLLYHHLKEKHKNSRIYARTNLQGIDDIADFYKMVRDNICLAPVIFPYCHTYGFPQLLFLTHCNRLKDKLWDNSRHELFPMLGMLEKEAGMIEILECIFLDTNMNVPACAELLFIHKNTVYYRLKKIQKYLGYDPFEMTVSVDLMLELALYRLLAQKGN